MLIFSCYVSELYASLGAERLVEAAVGAGGSHGFPTENRRRALVLLLWLSRMGKERLEKA